MYLTVMVSLSITKDETCPAWICSASLLKVRVSLARPELLYVTTKTTIATMIRMYISALRTRLEFTCASPGYSEGKTRLP